MKRFIAALMAVLVVLTLLAACSKDNQNENPDSSSDSTQSANPSTGPSSNPSSNPSSSTVPNIIPEGMEEEEWVLMPSKRGDVARLALDISNNLQPKNPGTIHIYMNQTAALDPAHSNLMEHCWCENVYESLFRKGTDGEFEPVLATEWYFDDQGRFHAILREGVKFHDGSGRIMTAEDVLYSVKRVVESPRSNAYAGMQGVDIENSYAENDYHVVIAFRAPTAAFMNFMASTYLGIVNKEFFEEVGPDYDFLSKSAGTGAYYVVDTVTGRSQTFKRFDDYWRGKPLMETIIATRYDDNLTAMGIDYENRDLDISLINTWETISRALDGEISDTYYYNVPNSRGVMMRYSTMNGPFSDIRVREAFSLAINPDDLVLAVFENPAIAVPATKVMIDGSYMGEHEYDIEKSKQLMQEAGYGPNNRLTINVYTSDYQPSVAMLELIQIIVEEIFIDVKIEIGTSPGMTALMASLEFPSAYDAIMSNYSVTPDPELFYNLVDAYGKEPGTFSGLKGIDDEYTCSLLRALPTTTDLDERAKLIDEIDRIFWDRNYYTPLLLITSACLAQGYIDPDSVIWRDGYGLYWYDLKYADWVNYNG